LAIEFAIILKLFYKVCYFRQQFEYEYFVGFAANQPPNPWIDKSLSFAA